jgi:hypothetical protein
MRRKVEIVKISIHTEHCDSGTKNTTSLRFSGVKIITYFWNYYFFMKSEKVLLLFFVIFTKSANKRENNNTTSIIIS